MSRYRISEIKLNIDESETILPSKIARKLGRVSGKIVPADIFDVEIVRRSIDARKGQVIRVYTVDFSCNKTLPLPEPPNTEYIIPFVGKFEDKTTEITCEGAGDGDGANGINVSEKDAVRPVVVGFGPCGMFCALVLARAGLSPIVIERGDDVETRMAKVEEFWRSGRLDPESNVQFGEGGAGTFSDGKLNTGIKDPRIRFVLETFVNAGADPDVLMDARPHIGTDALRGIVKRIREEIIALGGEVRFGTRLEGLDIDISIGSSNLEGDVARHTIRVSGPNGEESMECSAVVLALGHSARDTVRVLHAQGLKMEPKPFSMGVRVEHPQRLIDRGMYGEYAVFSAAGPDSTQEKNKPLLPPAYYKLSTKASDGRGVYSFCMCPGGEIVNAASQVGGVVTNGMSNHDRDSGFANSGILVDVRPEDYIEEMSMIPPELAGLAFQEKYEHLAFINGGGNYSLPTTTWSEYRSCFDSQPPTTTTNPVIASLPGFVARGIREAIPVFGQKIKGFNNDETIIKAIESRSSSPVRILRDKDSLQILPGIYPGGEGAGYAGGITSAACDGIKIAEKIIAQIIND